MQDILTQGIAVDQRKRTYDAVYILKVEKERRACIGLHVWCHFTLKRSKICCQSFLVNLGPIGKPTHMESSNLDKIWLSYDHLRALGPCRTLGVLGLDGGASIGESGVMIVVVSCTLYII